MNKNDEYTKNFKDPRWQKKRLKILERDNWHCVICENKEAMLVVHHLWYGQIKDEKSGEYRRRFPWEYDDNDLITLCEECHEDEHISRSEQESDLLMILRQKRFLSHDIYGLTEAILGMDNEIDRSVAFFVLGKILRNKKIFQEISNFFEPH